MDELAQHARRIIDTNKYLTLATVGTDGLPWASPVFFTPDGYSDLYWASAPDTQHSRNLAHRPDVAIVVFDSTVPIGGAQAVYMRALVTMVPDDDLAERAAFYCARVPETRSFLDELLRPSSLFRLYHATVSEHSVLVRGGDPKYGTGADNRIVVHPD
jgi:uncharacterized protein YhbP (UPF0306 family)